MTDSNIFKLNKPEQNDPLQEVLREGARKMLAAAIETEVSDFIKQHGSLKTDEGELAVVRNGYLPARSIQDSETLRSKCQRFEIALSRASSLTVAWCRRT